MALTVEKSMPTVWAISVILIKLLKVNNHRLGENSPHLVTLLVSLDWLDPSRVARW
jgi:hypothetical protein